MKRKNENWPVGKFKDYDVLIKRKDTGKPHMHIINEELNFDASVELFDNKYTSDSKNKLSDEECIEFNTWIRKRDPVVPIPTLYWEIGNLGWQVATGDDNVIITPDMHVPDYTIIERC